MGKETFSLQENFKKNSHFAKKIVRLKLSREDTNRTKIMKQLLRKIIMNFFNKYPTKNV